MKNGLGIDPMRREFCECNVMWKNVREYGDFSTWGQTDKKHQIIGGKVNSFSSRGQIWDKLKWTRDNVIRIGLRVETDDWWPKYRKGQVILGWVLRL